MLIYLGLFNFLLVSGIMIFTASNGASKVSNHELKTVEHMAD
jgi:hypothetical protein